MDTHKYVKSLMDAGFNVATKDDLARLEVRLFKGNLVIAGVLFAALSLVVAFAAR